LQLPQKLTAMGMEVAVITEEAITEEAIGDMEATGATEVGDIMAATTEAPIITVDRTTMTTDFMVAHTIITAPHTASPSDLEDTVGGATAGTVDTIIDK